MSELERGDGAYRLEDGYKIEKVIGGLSYPTCVAFDGEGNLYFTEAGFTYPFIYKEARIYRLARDGEKEQVAEGFEGPLIGLQWHDGAFLATHRGTLSRVGLDGSRADLVSGIPSYGDHHTNHIAIRDGVVYFGQGTVTNTGVIGVDNLAVFGWLAKHPEGHDVPAHDVVLSGKNYESVNPLNPLEKVETGPFLPLGTKATEGQRIPGERMATGVVYRVNPDGSDLRAFAWGLRNPYGLAVEPATGRLFVLDQGADARGCRPAEAPDALYEVHEGAWYGWPDFLAGKPITVYGDDLGFVLRDHPVHETPLAVFETHASAVTLDFSPGGAFGFEGQAFVAQYGTESPFTTGGKMVTAGRSVSRVDMATMTEYPFFESTTVAGIGKGPNRPVMAKFAPDGSALYVLDHGVRTLPLSGGLWKITRE